MSQVTIPAGMVRPTWRKWLTEAEIEDMGRVTNTYDTETGKLIGSSIGSWFSRVRCRDDHTPRTSRKDARWARRHGYVVDDQGIIRNPAKLEAIEQFQQRFGHR